LVPTHETGRGHVRPCLQGIVFAGIDEQLAFNANLSFVAFDADDPAAVSESGGLAVGDPVVLRCRLGVLNESGSLFPVKSWRTLSLTA
jgi:hypothetical protein